MNKRLPPFGSKFQPVPSTGVRVVIGPGAWDFAKRYYCPIMVLPDNAQPDELMWPSDATAALVYERGTRNNKRLGHLARELLIAGASSVVALRESPSNNDDHRVFFDPEVSNDFA